MPLPLCHLRSNASHCQEISSPSNASLPLSLLPSLGAGSAASQPNPKPSSLLFRAGNERRGSECSPQTR